MFRRRLVRYLSTRALLTPAETNRLPKHWCAAVLRAIYGRLVPDYLSLAANSRILNSVKNTVHI